MSFTDFVSSYPQKRIPSEISKRWNERVIACGLQNKGMAGAAEYLASYGKGIGVDKLVLLAQKAELENFPEMAKGFWARAYQLVHGVYPEVIQGVTDEVKSPPGFVPSVLPVLSGLPDSLQPGRLITMQAVDAPCKIEDYISDDRYWAQPKRDGSRLVVIATPEGIFYQARSMELKPSPSVEMNEALAKAVSELGSFILDGELYFRSASGSEHRTAAQARTANILQGAGETAPEMVYGIFKALYANGWDLRASFLEPVRIEYAETISTILGTGFELLPTARTRLEKEALVTTQKAEGREGEIWIDRNCAYVGGKDEKYGAMLRTKYLEELEVFVTELTRSQSLERPFKAAVVAVNGEEGLLEVGRVGTGFDAEQMRVLYEKHNESPGTVQIKVRCQGRTENGKLWHPRFLEFIN